MPGRTSILAGAGLAALAVLGTALYGSGLLPGNMAGAPQPCAGATQAVARVDASAKGEVAGMQAVTQARPAPEIRFKGPDGAETALSDLKGRLLLVNLWATWCAPCKAEMPALDRLQAELGGPDFTVVAINVDTRNLDKPPEWLKQAGIHALAFYADPGGRVLPTIQRDTQSPGLPTTMLIDPQGCTIGVMKGPAAWSSPDGLGLIRAVLGRTS
ncbi:MULTISPECIES: TlpA disulfide reductase family protein [unclassified Methylobacterium]|uniref:thiol:disulfide interchange protein TlpA n=1 Tax=unclassified Methylobacterium TaxID=2615210 RepID=UPI0011C1F02A|nr:MULTISPECIES: TlpA disulfide reductase family protein [unclassified Methylobacterium]QEE41220.1 TlpA family protein disulfide reductase [Methylobacterium sp. WL1]TXN01410.1 TlpA family protein disulfide reductase [Methylobacterium sp. WL64]TXN55108.1 TlpA family protein disulfide reductase [Methylobacterium sp. WL2]